MSSTDEKVLRLLHGKPIIFKDICLIYSPILDELANIGMNKFYQYLAMILVEKPVPDDEEMKELIKKLSTFEYLLLLTKMDVEREKMIREAFQFFTHEQVIFTLEPPSVVFGDGTEKRILTKNDFDEFQRDVQLCCASLNVDEDTIEFLETDSPKVRELKEQMLRGRKEREKAKAKASAQKNDEKSNLKFSDLVASLCTGSTNGINLLNVWNLSYYAFQDQLKRMGWHEEFNINTRAALAGAKIDKDKLSHWIKTMTFK